MSTSARILQLISLFQHHRRWSGPELADRLGVSARTLRRDVDRLRQLGYTIESDPGVDGGYRLAPGATLPPLSITADEAVALAVGLHGAAHSASTALAEWSVSALAKVVAMLPPELRRRADAISEVTSGVVPASGSATPAPDVLGVIAEGCRDGVRAAFAYTDAAGAATDRYVEPYRLVTVGQRWYLVAFDADRDDWRTFRVDRISEPRLTRTPFRPRQLPVDDLAAYVRDRLRTAAATSTATIRIGATIDEVRRVVGPWIGATPDGAATVVTMPVHDLRWVAVMIASFDVPVAVVDPPGLVGELHAMAARLAAVHSTGPTGENTP